VEEPLEIRLAGYSVAVTMRTPGDDFDLVVGFLFTEGAIRSASDIASIHRCPGDDPESSDNIVNVNPADPSLVDPSRWQRNFFTTSSCGICGKASIETVRQEARPIDSDLQVSHDTLYQLDRQLRSAQAVFDQTGGLHAAGLFDAGGELLALREDVGRHNAVDKVIGHALRSGMIPLNRHLLMVSGRASFEIVQKALMAGIPLVVSVSAPSSLALDLARSCGITLAGFLRQGRFNVYAGERITWQ
jgi:FdhD protein